MKFAVQLYTLRAQSETKEDFLGLFPKIKALGFDGVEFAGYHDLSAEEIKAALDAAGLVAVGTHTGIDNLKEENLEATLAFHKTIGCENIGIGGANTSTEKNLKRVLDIMGSAYKRAIKDGVRVYFHNHSSEFYPVEGSDNKALILDRIKEVCDIELDTYWSFCAGVDNYKYMTENKDKLVHIHIKDGIGKKPKALGEGENDLAAVIKAAKDIGLEWIILENDDPEPNGLADIERSMKYLKANV